MSSASRKFRLAGIVLTTVLLVGSSAVKLSHAQTANPGMSESPVHGKKLAETYCASCHGVDGNSADPQFPKIAGQNPDYIRLQLHAFKNGARASPIMSAPASALTNEQIAELARYFSDQPVKPNVVKDPQLARVGSRIFNEPSRDAPPCVACHGQGGFGPGGMTGGHMGMMGGHMGMMTGNAAEVPNLFGQHATYTAQQLDAFASGARHYTVMGPIAASLSSQDRQAVAEYLSGLQ